MNLPQAYYEQRFEILFLRAKGDEFQTFFERLMGLAYKADFMPHQQLLDGHWVDAPPVSPIPPRP